MSNAIFPKKKPDVISRIRHLVDLSYAEIVGKRMGAKYVILKVAKNHIKSIISVKISSKGIGKSSISNLRTSLLSDHSGRIGKNSMHSILI